MKRENPLYYRAMPVRLKDIAQDLGVSIVTVSKALRHNPDIAESTRERILQRVKDLNYRPNLMARSLVTGRSSLVGLIVPDLIHPFFGEVAKSLSRALRKRNFFVIVASSDGDPVLERQEIDHMLAHRLDALVVASSQMNADSLRTVGAQGPPLILLDRSFPGFSSHFVGTDDVQVGHLATSHLLAMGRKRIAHLRGPDNNVGRGRLEGYRSALQSKKIARNDKYVVASDVAEVHRAHGERGAAALLNLASRPDGIFCFNDAVATGAMMAAVAMGLRIPEDVAIVGCGNYHYDDTLQVPLTSVDQRTELIGERTAKMIFSLLDAKAPGRPKRAIVKPRLIQRTSSILGK